MPPPPARAQAIRNLDLGLGKVAGVSGDLALAVLLGAVRFLGDRGFPAGGWDDIFREMGPKAGELLRPGPRFYWSTRTKMTVREFPRPSFPPAGPDGRRTWRLGDVGVVVWRDGAGGEGDCAGHGGGAGKGREDDAREAREDYGPGYPERETSVLLPSRTGAEKEAERKEGGVMGWIFLMAAGIFFLVTLPESKGEDVLAQRISLALFMLGVFLGVPRRGTVVRISYFLEDLFNRAFPGSRAVARVNLEALAKEKQREAEMAAREALEYARQIRAPKRRLSAWEKLMRMPGLEELKAELKKLEKSARTRRYRIMRGHEVRGRTLHMVFTGPPGTGKTTAARLVGEILRDMGVLEKGHTVEVSRKDITGRYIGETENRLREFIERAYGGVLFVDEAYALSRFAGTNDFGVTAIDVLVEAMDKERENLVMIFAGYEQEMEEFMTLNPGFASRIWKKFVFRHYTPEELARIVRMKAEEMGYRLSPGAEERVLGVCRSSAEIRARAQTGKQVGFVKGGDRGSGNVPGDGRWARLFAEAIVEAHEVRHAEHPGMAGEIGPEDVVEAEREMERRGWE